MTPHGKRAEITVRSPERYLEGPVSVPSPIAIDILMVHNGEGQKLIYDIVKSLTQKRIQKRKGAVTDTDK